MLDAVGESGGRIVAARSLVELNLSVDLGGPVVEWVKALAPVFAAALVLLGAWITVQQKRRADARSAWWDRVEWAADKATSGDDWAEAVGQVALNVLNKDASREASDSRLLVALIDAQTDRSSANGQDSDVVLFVEEA